MKARYIIAPFALLLTLMVVISGCKKEDEPEDYRDQYVGTYQVKLTCYISSREPEPYDTSEAHFIQVEKDTADENGILVGFFKARLAQDGTFKSKVGTASEEGTIEGRFKGFTDIEYETYKGNTTNYNECTADGQKYSTDDESEKI